MIRMMTAIVLVLGLSAAAAAAQETARASAKAATAPAPSGAPVNLNTATDEDILSIPGAGARMVREFKEYRPWKTKAQFDKEIAKYVGAKETGRLWRYVTTQ